MSDGDKTPKWRKGLDMVKVFYGNTKYSISATDLRKQANAGQETIKDYYSQVRSEMNEWFLKNEKNQNNIFGRMQKNNSALLLSVRTHLKHRFYVYPTLKKRIFLFV